MWTAPTGGGGVKQLAVSRDGGTIWVGGDFNNIGGQARNKLAAVHGDGSVDPAFNPGPGNGAVVSALTLSEDNTRVYFGGTFDQVKEEVRNNLAAVDARTGALTAWDPNATGAVSSLTASGSLVYAGGSFTNLGATPRTLLGALDITPGAGFGAALPSPPRSRTSVAGRQGRRAAGHPGHRDGARRVPAVHRRQLRPHQRRRAEELGRPAPARRRGRPQLRPRRAAGRGAGHPLRCRASNSSTPAATSTRSRSRPGIDCGVPTTTPAAGHAQHKDSVLTPQNRCIWKRSKIVAYEAGTGFLDLGFQGPDVDRRRG